MAGVNPFFYSCGVNVLQNLVLNQFSEISHMNTSQTLRTAKDKLSALTSAFESVLADIEAGGKETTDLLAEVGKVENILAWDKLLKLTKPTPSDPQFIFRAHTHVGRGQPTFVPSLNRPLDFDFKSTISVDTFACLLAEHLNKIQSEIESGKKILTCFVSMSPTLEWAMHKAGQKWKEIMMESRDEVVGLAIFDLKILREDPSTTIFRVSDILGFLEEEGKAYLIGQKLQQWARNCDEYVSLGGMSNAGLVNWVNWLELQSPSSFLPDCFTRAYTLRTYCEWIQQPKNQRQVEPEDINWRFREFGKILAGSRQDLLLPLISLLKSPGLHFWGFQEARSPADVVETTLQTFSLTD